jgi:hypothetical protein
MPVAALIVIRPGVKVKAVKGDALRSDRNCGEQGTNVAIKAVFVHTKV